MKRFYVLVIGFTQAFTMAAQQQQDNEAIKSLLSTFMTAIRTRDSVTMFSLFADVPVTWVGAWQPATLKARAANVNAPVYRVSDYKTWFRSVMADGYKEELFSNPVIVHDGTIGSVTFDYSFWANHEKGNWGKESWGLVKIDGKWKIVSVIFSMELERYRQQPAQYTDTKSKLHPGIEQYLQSFIDTADYRGVVLVAKGDSVLHHGAYGLFDTENKIPNQLKTQFLIGSLTKSFTAVAIMQLVEAGKIDLHAPLQQYIPGLLAKLAKGLTVHHLLKQQSGLPVFIEDITPVDIMDISPGELLAEINRSERHFEPGKKHEYSNINYNLLAMAIENVSGMTYAQYLQENIFTPLDMTSSGNERLINIPANRAIGYRTINGVKRRVQNVTAYALGTGDIFSTADDLLKWSNALHRGTLLSEKSKALLFDGGPEDWGYYGYGFRIQPYERAQSLLPAGTLIRHGGTMNGFVSNYHYYKEDDLTIILLSNFRNTPIRTLTYRIKEIALNAGQPARKKKYADE
jgi:CubicO group peptidase (beta-lactamase class C family)